MTEIPKLFKAHGAPSTAVVAASQGPSFTAFYAKHAAELINGLRNRFGDGPPEPEDVAQEAFRRVFEHPEFSDVKNKRAFLWRTAINLAASDLRKIEVRDRRAPDLQDIFFTEDGDNSTPESVLCIREQLDAIGKLVEGMPEKRQRIFIMRRMENYTVAQIGRMVGMSHSGVIKHLQVADQQISDLLLKVEG